MASEIGAWVRRLAAGDATLDEVAAVFESHTWPSAGRARTAAELYRAEQNDEPPDEGTFAEVEEAYVNGRITRGQYTRLAEAAAAAIDGRGEGGRR